MFDPYGDVQAKLDRALLDRAEPPCHAPAREQLAKAGVKVKRIIQALPDAILFVNDSDVVMTAWSEVRPSGTVAFFCEAGMPADPPAVREAA